MTRVSADLLAEARRGDDRAIAQVLSLARPDIRRYAQRTCRTTTDVEDAVQEVLLILHRRMPALAQLRSLGGWLFVVAHRVCLRLLKSGLPGAEVALWPRADLAAADPADLRLDLTRALASLPQSYREVILLRDVEALTIEEIAARTGASRAAVKARLHRARGLAREYLTAD